jgi:hypothetical protein
VQLFKTYQAIKITIPDSHNAFDLFGSNMLDSLTDLFNTILPDPFPRLIHSVFTSVQVKDGFCIPEKVSLKNLKIQVKVNLPPHQLRTHLQNLGRNSAQSSFFGSSLGDCVL